MIERRFESRRSIDRCGDEIAKPLDRELAVAGLQFNRLFHGVNIPRAIVNRQAHRKREPDHPADYPSALNAVRPG